MNKIIYLLKSDTRNHSSFIEDYSDGEESIIRRAIGKSWKNFTDYSPVRLEVSKSDLGRKNFQFDFSGSLKPFLIFSESAFDALNDILAPRGNILPVITDSKKKNYVGYYPTNVLSGCFDMETSVYKKYPLGLKIDKPVLIAANISDDYIFTIEEDISRIFVTENFKQRVEEAGLLGFDFSVVIPTS